MTSACSASLNHICLFCIAQSHLPLTLLASTVILIAAAVMSLYDDVHTSMQA